MYYRRFRRRRLLYRIGQSKRLLKKQDKALRSVKTLLRTFSTDVITIEQSTIDVKEYVDSGKKPP